MMNKATLVLVAAGLAFGIASPAFADCLESGAAECGNYGSGGSYASSRSNYHPYYGSVRHQGIQTPYEPR